MSNSNDRDELLKRLARLEGRAAEAKETAAETKADPMQDAPSFFRGIRSIGIFADRARMMGMYAWEKIGSPIWSVFKPSALWVKDRYMNNVWPWAYGKDDNGEPVFSKKRAGIVLVATFAAAAMAMPVANGVFHAGMDATKMATSTRTETVYLHTQNSHGDNTYSVKGCRTADSCTTDDVVYYNVEKSFMRHAWSLWNKGSLFIPKTLMGNIAPDANNKCEVTIYGAKYEKFYQNFEHYPDLLDISCERVSSHIDSAASIGSDFQDVASIQGDVAAEFLPYETAKANISYNALLPV